MYVFRYVMCVFRHVLFVWILSLQPPHEENAIAVLLRIRTINMDSMQRTIEQKKKKTDRDIHTPSFQEGSWNHKCLGYGQKKREKSLP